MNTAHVSVDIFCAVVDNYGDAGGAWRLALAMRRWFGGRFRLFIDDRALLNRIAPPALQSGEAIERIDQTDPLAFAQALHEEPARLIIETYGCGIPQPYLDRHAQQSLLIINVEHLGLQPWIEEWHRRPELCAQTTITKFWYMPGFTPHSGGVLLSKPPTVHDTGARHRRLSHLLAALGIQNQPDEHTLSVALFGYERDYSPLLQALAHSGQQVLVLVLGEKAQASIEASCWRESERVAVQMVPFMPQQDFDALIASVELALVRGENSLLSALEGGTPFIWQLYAEPNDYHLVKLQAFMQTLDQYLDNQDFSRSYAELSAALNRAEPGAPTHLQYEHFINHRHCLGDALRRMHTALWQSANLSQSLFSFLTTSLEEHSTHGTRSSTITHR